MRRQPADGSNDLSGLDGTGRLRTLDVPGFRLHEVTSEAASVVLTKVTMGTNPGRGAPKAIATPTMATSIASRSVTRLTITLKTTAMRISQLRDRRIDRTKCVSGSGGYVFGEGTSRIAGHRCPRGNTLL
jgi:hypothetical protein